MTGMSILRQALSLMGQSRRLTADDGDESGLLAVNQIYGELWHRDNEGEFVPLSHLRQKVALSPRLLPAMTYGTAALLCVAAEDSGPYDRYLELYLRALTHAGGTPYRRRDLLGEVSAL